MTTTIKTIIPLNEHAEIVLEPLAPVGDVVALKATIRFTNSIHLSPALLSRALDGGVIEKSIKQQLMNRLFPWEDKK